MTSSAMGIICVIALSIIIVMCVIGLLIFGAGINRTKDDVECNYYYVSSILVGLVIVATSIFLKDLVKDIKYRQDPSLIDKDITELQKRKEFYINLKN